MYLAFLLCKSERMPQGTNQQKNNTEDTVSVAAQRMAEILVALLGKERESLPSQPIRKTNEEKQKHKDLL